MLMFRPSLTRNRIAALLMALVLCASIYAVAPKAMAATATPAPTKDTYDAANPENLKAEDLRGSSCLLMDRGSGRVLFDKNGYTRRYPASTTKIMTLLLALEYGHLNDMVTLPAETDKVPSDSSRVPVFSGEKMPFIDLLYGMMIRSGNDAANAVAVIVGGSLDAFSKMMNERAKELGCKGTHFVNAHGYHDENHYSTAYDLALITKEGMRHDTFRTIVSARSYTMTITDHLKIDGRGEKLRLESGNTMFVNGKDNKYYYAPLVGVKSGSHSKAGNCFVGAAKKNGVNLISVTLGVPVGQRNMMWQDTKRLFEYGFPQYVAYNFDQLYGLAPVYVAIQDADPDDQGNGMLALSAVPGGSANDYTVYRLPDEQKQIVEEFQAGRTVEYSGSLTAPVRQGDIIGTLKIKGDGGDELTTRLIASRDVLDAPATTDLEELFPWMEALNFSPVKLMLALVALILLLIIMLRIRIVSRRNRKRREALRRRQQAYERYRSYKG